MVLKNHYYIMRHGQAISNVKSLCSSWPEKFRNPLTKLGRKTVKKSAKNLLDKNIDLIFSSPLLRTKQTAEIVGKVLGVESKIDKSSTNFGNPKLVLDKRLREVGFGIFNGKKLESMWKSFKIEEERIKKGADGGETYEQILERMMSFLKDVDKKYSPPHQTEVQQDKGGKAKNPGYGVGVNRNILIISHEGPLSLLQGKVMGLSIKETIKKFPLDKRIHKGEIRELN